MVYFEGPYRYLLQLFHSKESVIEIKVKTKNLRKSIEISTRCFFDQICKELLAKENLQGFTKEILI